MTASSSTTFELASPSTVLQAARNFAETLAETPQYTTNMPPDFLAATQSLAETLLHAEPIVAFRLAGARLQADLAARALLERLSTAQATMRARQARNAVTQVEIDAVRTLQHEVQANRAISDYFDAQQAATAYLREINLEISQLLGLDFASFAGASCGPTAGSGCC